MNKVTLIINEESNVFIAKWWIFNTNRCSTDTPNLAHCSNDIIQLASVSPMEAWNTVSRSCDGVRPAEIIFLQAGWKRFEAALRPSLSHICELFSEWSSETLHTGFRLCRCLKVMNVLHLRPHPAAPWMVKAYSALKLPEVQLHLRGKKRSPNHITLRGNRQDELKGFITKLSRKSFLEAFSDSPP